MPNETIVDNARIISDTNDSIKVNGITYTGKSYDTIANALLNGAHIVVAEQDLIQEAANFTNPIESGDTLILYNGTVDWDNEKGKLRIGSGAAFEAEKVTFTGSTAYALQMRGTTMTLTDCDFIGNAGNGISSDNGGSTNNTPFITLSNVTFDGNDVAISTGVGVSVYLKGKVTLKTRTDTIKMVSNGLIINSSDFFTSTDEVGVKTVVDASAMGVFGTSTNYWLLDNTNKDRINLTKTESVRVIQDATGYFLAQNTTDAGIVSDENDHCVTANGVTYAGIRYETLAAAIVKNIVAAEGKDLSVSDKLEFKNQQLFLVNGTLTSTGDNGLRVLAGGTCFANNMTFISTSAAPLLFVRKGGVLTVSNSTFTGTGSALAICADAGGNASDPRASVTLTGNITFEGNQSAINVSTTDLYVKGKLILKTATDTINKGTLKINSSDYFTDADEVGVKTVVDAGAMKVFGTSTDNWLNADASMSLTGNAVVIQDATGYFLAQNTTDAGIVSDENDHCVTVNGVTYAGIRYTSITAALAAENVVAAEHDFTLEGTTISNKTLILSDGEADLSAGRIRVNANATLIADKVVFGDSSQAAIFMRNGTVTVNNSTFSNSAEHGISADTGGSIVLSDVTFNGNTKGAINAGGPSSGSLGVYVYLRGKVTLKTTSDTISGTSGRIVVDSSDFFTSANEVGVKTVVDAFAMGGIGSDSSNWLKKGSIALTGNDVAIQDATGYYLARNTTAAGIVSDNNNHCITVNGVTYAGIRYATVADALNSENMVIAENIEISDAIDTAAGQTLCLTGNVGINANITGTGNINIADAQVTFGNSEAISVAALTFSGAESNILFNGALVNFTGLDASEAAITVDGSVYENSTVTIATGVTAIGAYTINNKSNVYLELAVVDNDLVLKEIDAQITGESDLASYTGSGLTVMDGGKVGTFFADKSGADNIATKISGGKVESNLVGGAYVAAGNTAAVDNVELLIGGTAEVAAKVYAGGYLYGNGADSAEAQLTVGEVNITIDGGAVSTNMFGGAHARQNGNASVTEVNITVTAGNHGRIYAGGWAEKGAVSSVGTANVIISGGTVDYLYGAGANADGKTYVTTSNITIENDAVVNTIFMGGRYGYSWVENVNLTFAGENKELTRLSGVSSAGMDYADATNVELKTNVTADLIDYVDKFVINEGCMLTANDAFYLGNRLENGETADFTTFNFIAEGEANWTAVAGISDFNNAKFAVNGSEAQLWDGKAAIAIGGYELTYDATDKTIKLAQITA